MQVLVKVDLLLLDQIGTARPSLESAPADDPEHVDQLISTQFHLEGTLQYSSEKSKICLSVSFLSLSLSLSLFSFFSFSLSPSSPSSLSTQKLNTYFEIDCKHE